MGFIKSLAQLTKQGYEMQNNRDVDAEFADAQSSMAGMQALLAQQTQAANLAQTGVDAVATITGVRQGPGMVNYQPTLDIDLLIDLNRHPTPPPVPAAAADPLVKTPPAPAGVPIPVTVSLVVPQLYLPKAQPGNQVAVKVDPANPQTAFINWGAPVL